MQSNSFSSRLYKLLAERTKTFVYFPLALYWLTIFILTTIPTDAIPQFFNAQDKIEHFSAYFLLAVLLNLTLYFQKQFKLISDKSFLFASLFVAGYGAIDELHQIFIPGRTCDFFDWTADATGGIIGVWIVYIFLRKVATSVAQETVS
ncbi:MAG: VanZ family protein [Bacteroidetes bacterium]|nr:VanZ family protein [Bacteroidota bacterium]